jgi:prepilin signal peptidase PulO-like enzyme (type II secretory pathway)
MTELVRSRYVKTGLPYLGIPLIIAALLVFRGEQPQQLILLQYIMIITFGYIAAVGDIKTKTISNFLVLSMLVSWVVITTPTLFFDPSTAIPVLIDSALGFAVTGVLFLIVYFVSRKGLGGGDVKFMSAAGLYLGLSNALTATLIGTIFAALTGLILIALKRINRKDSIPLVPFLYLGILIAVFI